MTWGITTTKKCQDCANNGRCYIKNAFWNLASTLTSVDRLVPPNGNLNDSTNWECAGGQLTADCNGFKPKEETKVEATVTCDAAKQ